MAGPCEQRPSIVDAKAITLPDMVASIRKGWQQWCKQRTSAAMCLSRSLASEVQWLAGMRVRHGVPEATGKTRRRS